MFGLTLATGCQHDEAKVDHTPLPTVAAPPYICEHIPLRAVELMTGQHDPLVRGHFDLTLSGGLGDGSCVVYRPGGNRLKVLQIGLTPQGYSGGVEEQLHLGALPLPEIVPGATGYYFKDPNSTNNAAHALLVWGNAELGIDLVIGVEGRDNAADVVALMKLIAPKLITDASAPGATVSPSP
ncbi:hypothetical protein ACFHYQ_13710 [Sphaerimonospora cavernae]|uniref:DUF3558 domain-containing protein n=1 Tax=Sphaerimonospora cavernae TaxID=1740611 RepID=A0ABV6U624_9ACTN